VFEAKKEAVMTASTRSEFGSVSEPTLYVAFELSAKQWKLALTSGWGIAPWVRTVPSGELSAVARVISQARTRFGLPSSAPVVSCYEAGRDGFWIHRALQSLGVANRVVDSASIEVNRRARRAKTDRLDALKLVTMLVRVCSGERGVWREVRVPSVADEAARQVSRERTALTEEQTRLTNQMRGWLATWGCVLPARRTDGWWATVRDWAGAPLPDPIQARLGRAHTRWVALAAQIAALDDQQHVAMTTAAADSALGRLVQIKGVATTSASVLLDEGLVWREFRNRREVGGVLGFAPTPYQSGDRYHEQGIGRAGNHRLQAMSVQLAWQWVRWQPDSPITQWYRARYAAGSGRLRRIGIVGVARRLMIALWRYATTGVIPAGAIVKLT
jgi:transposase